MSIASYLAGLRERAQALETATAPLRDQARPHSLVEELANISLSMSKLDEEACSLRAASLADALGQSALWSAANNVRR